MRLTTYILALTLPIVLSLHAEGAQTIIGGSAAGMQCYTTAKMVSEKNIKKLADVEPCNRALKEDSLNKHDRAATLVNRGLINAVLGNFELAHDDYDEAVRVNPETLGITHINRGNAYYMQQNYQDALDSYTRAVEMNADPRHAAIHNQAMAYEKVGDLDAAEAGFLKALELVPGWETAQLRLERVRQKQLEKQQLEKQQLEKHAGEK
jgi:tetratricopeptide (TPR) repeat protein